MHVQLQAHETHAGAAINPAARRYNTYACIMSLSSHVTLRAHPQAVAPAYMVGSPRKQLRLHHGPSKGAPVRSQPRLHGQKYWNLVHQK